MRSGDLGSDGEPWTILLVDDQSTFREVLGLGLKRQGFRVLQAGSGREALACLQEQPAGVRLVITDIAMPGLDGLELAEELGRRAPDLPILLITGLSDQNPCCNGRTLPLLLKPFRMSELMGQIHELLGPSNESLRQAPPGSY